MICQRCQKTFIDNTLKECPDCASLLEEDCVIKNIIIKNLFNVNDYEINLPTDSKISILIAPNGFGKSTIFKFINFFYNPTLQDLEYISTIPFDCFTINFTNGGFVSIEKSKTKPPIKDFEKYNFIIKGKLNKLSKSINLNLVNDFLEPRLADLSLDKIYECFSFEIKNIFANTDNKFFPLSGMYLNLKRLEITNEKKQELMAKNTVDKNKNKNYLPYKYENYAFDFDNDNSTKMYLYNQIVRDVISLEEDLKSHNKTKYNILKREFQMFKDNFDLFCKIYNERNKNSGKTISYDNDGFKIKCGDNIINIENLSDGEKNDFCLFFSLIHSATPISTPHARSPMRFTSLIIIDEPEVSLHIEWQKTWLDYVKQICEIKNVQIIIATHSPYIVNGNFDLYVDKKVKKHGSK